MIQANNSGLPNNASLRYDQSLSKAETSARPSNTNPAQSKVETAAQQAKQNLTHSALNRHQTAAATLAAASELVSKREIQLASHKLASFFNSHLVVTESKDSNPDPRGQQQDQKNKKGKAKAKTEIQLGHLFDGYDAFLARREKESLKHRKASVSPYANLTNVKKFFTSKSTEK